MHIFCMIFHTSVTVFVYFRKSVYIICCWSIYWLFVFKPQSLQLRCQQTVMSVSPGRQIYSEKNLKSAQRRHSLIERRMLFQRLPTEVQLLNQHSVSSIHVLAICQYHIHHLPVYLCCTSKSYMPLLIYNLNFWVHSFYPRILVFHCTFSHVNPSPVSKSSHLTFSPVSVFWKEPPFHFEIWQLPFCFSPPLFSSCQISIT